jgi:hypothetical protein
MSNLLEQASLVLIPSGYKEDVVYSQIPLDGSGDLALTRASNGTRVNSAGLVEVCPWNLLEQSETFDTASWPKLECSITANSTNSPIGTLTADSLIESNTNSRHMIYRAFTSVVGQSYSLSVYCKQSTRRYANINLKTSSTASPRFSALFDLQTGLNVSTSAVGSPTGTSFDIVSFPNGWYRISISMNATSTSTEYEISTSNSATPSLAEGTPAYLGDGTSGIYIWGAQLNIGATAKPYFPTTDRLNVPRLTYQNGGGGCPSLLLEKQSTNLITYSEDFTHSNWGNYTTGSGAITKIANQAISPDGTQNADEIRLTRSALTEDALTFQQQYASSSTYSRTIYLKAARTEDVGKKIDIWSYDGSNTVGRVHATLTADWVRFDASTATGALVEILSFGYLSSSTFPTTSGTDVRFYAWGAQGEASSYPTSLINTTSASATRVADACFKTGISSLIGQTEGTIFLDAQRLYMSGDRSVCVIYTSGSSYIQVYLINDIRVIINGTVIMTGQTIAENTRYKIAIAYKSGDHAMYVNGTQIATTSTSIAPTVLNDLYVGNAFSTEQSGLYNEAVLFKTRLTNSELQSLTTL